MHCFWLQIKAELKEWDPLRDPKKHMSTFQTWKNLLEDPNRHYNQPNDNMDPYERLVWETWMPCLRSSVW